MNFGKINLKAKGILKFLVVNESLSEADNNNMSFASQNLISNASSNLDLDPKPEPVRPQLHDTGSVSERHQFKVFSSLVCYYNFLYMDILFNYIILP